MLTQNQIEHVDEAICAPLCIVVGRCIKNESFNKSNLKMLNIKIATNSRIEMNEIVDFFAFPFFNKLFFPFPFEFAIKFPRIKSKMWCIR